jgi:MFS family permease
MISAAAIYAGVAFSGLAFAFDGPARQSLIPALVPKEDLPNALSLYSVIWQLANVIGPAVGGALIGRIGVLPIYLADSASFLAVIGALILMQVESARSTRGTISFSAALEGLSFIRKTPLISTTMLLDFVATFFGGSMLLMPIFADQLLQVGAEGLGVLYAAQPAGAALAALVMSSRPAVERQGVVLLASVATYGAAIAAFGVSSSLLLAILFLAISGAADTVSTVIRQTLRQLLTPNELRGRMTSINMMFFIGGPQLGEVEAGAVAKLFGARVSVSSGGLLCLAAVAVVSLGVPALRRITQSEVLAIARDNDQGPGRTKVTVN